MNEMSPNLTGPINQGYTWLLRLYSLSFLFFFFLGYTNNVIETEQITQQPSYIGGHPPHTIFHTPQAQSLHSKEFKKKKSHFYVEIRFCPNIIMD